MTDKVVLLFVVALAAAAPPAAAQSHRASMRGLVTDSTGAVLRGANVEATQRTTNERRTVTTDEGGRFAAPELPVGPYVVEITLAGYRSHTTRADLAVGEELWLDVPLAVDRQDVEVRAVRPNRRDSPAMGTLIDKRQIIGLPLDGRNFLELALLAPGTAPAPQGSASSVRGDFAFTVNGAREDCQRVPARRRLQHRSEAGHAGRAAAGRRHPRVRGADVHLRCVVRPQRGRPGQRDHALGHQPLRRHRVRVLPQRRARRAQLLRAAATSRSPTTTATSSAGRIGGPIARDRTFFFADYEGTRCARASRASPTCRPLAERTGDFSQSLFARPVNPFTRQPFPGGRIPPFVQPDRGGDRGALSAAESRDAVRQLRLVADAAR